MLKEALNLVVDDFYRDLVPRNALVKRSFIQLQPSIGIIYQRANDKVYNSIGYGMEIIEVQPGSGAEKAKLQVGDIILRVDETPLVLEGDLPNIVSQKKPFRYIKLKILRQSVKKYFDQNVRLGYVGQPVKNK